MNVQKLISSPWVFVDDSDTAIMYSGPWVPTKGIPTGLNSLTQPESLNTPAYGTLHIMQDTIINSTLSYLFNGTDFVAMFRGEVGSQAIIQNASCTIDGVQQSFESFNGSGTQWASCFNKKPLSSTSHSLSISIPATVTGSVVLPNVSFDWLAYNPLKAPERDTDMLHSMSLTNVTPMSFLFQFHAIVQNKTKSADLTPFPSIQSSVTSNKAPDAVSSTISSSSSRTTPSVPPTANGRHNSRHINSGIIAAIVLSAVSTLVIALWFWKRNAMRRIMMVQAQEWQSAAKPFPPPHPAQAGRFRLAQYTTAEKTNKYQEAFGNSIPQPERQSPETHSEAGNLEQDNPRDEVRVVRYRVHEDAGSLVTDRDDIISLPPFYDALRRSRPHSHTTGAPSTDENT